MTSDTRLPVIVGVGEVNDRPAAAEDGLDPVELMAAAARAADVDAGGGWLARCDRVAITPQISSRELDAPALLPAALGTAPRRIDQAPSADGDSPVRHLHDAANAVADGSAAVCLVVGGEAVRIATHRAAAAGGGGSLFKGSLQSASPLRRRYGLVMASDLYRCTRTPPAPLGGRRWRKGRPRPARSGRASPRWRRQAWARGSGRRAPRRRSSSPARTTGRSHSLHQADRRQLVGQPGAALIVTSLAAARAAGIAEERLVFFGAGAAAHEAHDPLERATWSESPSMRVALERTMALNGLEADDLNHVELYSCFPCVPKMARRVLGLSADRPLTVHGGLTFGGGPIGNYMTHAAAAMVRALRRGGRFGLLYGNGGHCTHNHALVLSSAPVPDVALPQNYDCQAQADRRREPLPALGDDREGPARIETYTVVYGRDGAPERGVVLARDATGARVVARVSPADAGTIAFLTDGAAEPVGAPGRTVRVGDALEWRRA